MNQWLLDHYLSSQPPLRLERVQSGRAVSIVLAHSEQTSEPAWIIKTSSDPDGIRRLRLEGDALHYLKPWAMELGIPQVLEWRVGSTEACLARTVMPGKIYPVRLLLSSSLDQLAAVFRQPLNWLKRFRRKCPRPGPGVLMIWQVVCARVCVKPVMHRCSRWHNTWKKIWLG